MNGAASADDKKNGERPSEKKGIDCAEDVARLAFDFVKVAGSTIEGLDVEDDVRLLRVRTKKVELVIVPGKHFCFPSCLWDIVRRLTNSIMQIRNTFWL